MILRESKHDFRRESMYAYKVARVSTKASLALAVSAPAHTDKQDVFVLQTQGSKHWRVFAPPPPANKMAAGPLPLGSPTPRLLPFTHSLTLLLPFTHSLTLLLPFTHSLGSREA